ncbi:hypothetical protein TR13x_07925 [Caloranaerobacter sp. TR13]|uniref:hypothetical protein n=1 Tax=Caloranaerobacter sp. TR13 TaxID=1302151 RepID=UPI0006D48BA0|nr:hypothetical protein [Caloranaerobacter sp. TR13]KPU26828.1 hypothetical protein TR13x_07925 [Caloranaerobacter sp. TR13]
MPFDVYDINNKHIGVITTSFPNDTDILMISITDLKASDIDLDIDSIKMYVAELYGCKNILGKIKEDKLVEILLNIWGNKYKSYGEYNEKLLFRLLLLEQLCNIERFIRIDKSKIYGYLLLDRKNVDINGENIIIKENIDYIEANVGENGIPIYGKVVDYPIITVENMGVGEGLLLGADFSDFGGRNHTHKTKFKLLSGNVILPITVPISLRIKRGMTVKIYLEKRNIKKIFCDGVFYTYYNS